MFWDPSGLDAILMDKEVDAMPKVEHMGAFFQDENEDWYFFYWEGDSVRYEKVEDVSIFDSQDKINEYLLEKGLNKKEDKPYTDFVYVKGNFTESHKQALAMKEYIRKKCY